MRVCDLIHCKNFPCTDVNHKSYILPDNKLNSDSVRLIMISEAAPNDPKDYYYADGNPLYQTNTVQAFGFGGLDQTTFQELLNRGFYFTTAVKCGKTGYGIKTETIKECSLLLEEELNLFQNVEVLMLMGDVAIKSINYIAKRLGEPRPVPAGSTYKIRSGEFFFRQTRVFPSYLQVGPSFGIEKSKQQMIGEDIAKALEIIG